MIKPLPTITNFRLGAPRLITIGLTLSAAVLSIASSKPKVLEAYDLTLPGSVVKIHMVPVPGGKVMVGGKEVTLQPYFMAESETPWEAYDVFLASGPPSKAYDQTDFPLDAIARPSKSYILPDLGWGHHGFPVINVSFTSVTMFCRWLAKETGKKYRLPTEAEWQLAAQDGQSTEKKLTGSDLDSQAWYSGNSGDLTHPIKKKAPNKLGLYDIFGNVGEWATEADGKAVLCGSHFRDKAEDNSSLTRRHWAPAWQEEDPQLPKSRWWLSDGNFVGFRLVCEAS